MSEIITPDVKLVFGTLVIMLSMMVFVYCVTLVTMLITVNIVYDWHTKHLFPYYMTIQAQACRHKKLWWSKRFKFLTFLFRDFDMGTASRLEPSVPYTLFTSLLSPSQPPLTALHSYCTETHTRKSGKFTFTLKCSILRLVSKSARIEPIFMSHVIVHLYPLWCHSKRLWGYSSFKIGETVC